MANLLIIDDDRQLSKVLTEILASFGHHVDSAENLESGMSLVGATPFDVVFLDVMLPDGYGLDHIPALKSSVGRPDIIIITGSQDLDGAALAMENGAWHYMCKPINLNEAKLQVERVLQYRHEKHGPQPDIILKKEGIIGSSPQLESCLDKVAQAAPAMVNVLITGETGTGKELFAKAIHDNSPRTHNPFVVLDCTALPEKLIESTLFGYEKGAFTGAEKSNPGLIVRAHNGTLFMDEVGELPLNMQKKLLRVLQERRFRSVGGRKEIFSDFRMVVATNRDLKKMVADGSFRDDLLFRLQAFHIHLPPLRKRLPDIHELAVYHVFKICVRNNVEPKEMSSEFAEALVAYEWPGNVRELVNTLDMAIATATFSPVLYPIHLPGYIRTRLLRASMKKGQTLESSPEHVGMDLQQFPTLKVVRQKSIEDTEARYLRELMVITGGDIKSACRLSGIQRTRLWELFKKYGIEKPSNKAENSR